MFDKPLTHDQLAHWYRDAGTLAFNEDGEMVFRVLIQEVESLRERVGGLAIEVGDANRRIHQLEVSHDEWRTKAKRAERSRQAYIASTSKMLEAAKKQIARAEKAEERVLDLHRRASLAENERDRYKAAVDAAQNLYPHLVGETGGVDPETAEGALVEALEVLNQEESAR